MLEFEKIINIPTPIEQLADDLFDQKQLKVFVKRDDLTHPLVSGNKFRKLKYNLIEAKKQSKTALVTFGGAYSNHILAVAAAGNLFGFETKGIIRGHELNEKSTKTLMDAIKLGMQLDFITRAEYRLKNYNPSENEYLIPEGGSNRLALLGMAEMIDELNEDYDYIVLAVGTGGSMAGVLSNKNIKSKVIGIPVLKNGSFLLADISKLLKSTFPRNATLMLDYHFGGYGKFDNSLLDFMHNIESKFGFLLDQVYTAKVFYGIYDLIQKDYFAPNSKILIVHTGGVQGRLK